MSPLDSLKRIAPKKDKIYRPSSRINFLINQPEEMGQLPGPVLIKPALKKYAIAKIILIGLFIFFIITAMYLSERIFSTQNKTLVGLKKFNPFLQLARLVTGGDKWVAGQLEDRVNILALGIGGEGHDGPYLTDTIMVISLKPSSGEVGLLSIPRDMVVKIKNNGWQKINQIYSLGRVTSEAAGLKNIEQAIEDTLDIKIHYYGLITFKGFEEFIDQIGGIAIDVPQSFTDPLYPTNDYYTQTVSFTKGRQTMDGPTALIYARSRHGNNFEGSDFARSHRQQLILEAVKDKLFRFSTLLSPNKLSAILDLLGNSLKTNMSIWQALQIADMVKQTGQDKIYRLILDDSPDSLLEPGFTEEGAWILQPKDGNFQTLSRQFNNIFNRSKISQEGAKIAIQNGTAKDGLAYWTAVHLEKLGYQIVKYGNASSQDYQRTIIYDLNNSQQKNTLKWLKEELSAYLSKTPPEELNQSTALEQNPPPADLTIILGQDWADRFKLPELKPLIGSTSTLPTATSTKNLTATATEKVTE